MFRLSEYKLRKYNFKIILLVITLCVIGYLVLTSAMANDSDRDSTLLKQLIGFGVGGFIMIFLSLVDYHFILRMSSVIYIGMLGLLAAVLLVGVSANNATRWLSLGFFQIQPSEFAKIGIIVVFAAYFMNHRDQINRPWILGGALLLYAVPAFLILKEPDLSTTLVTVFIFLCMLYAAKLSYKWILGACAAAIPLGALFIFLIMNDMILAEYQRNRILSWIFPDQYESTGLTTQQDNSVLAISSGQLYGKGLNNTSFESVKNGEFLSEENCDFIFAVIGEELGFIGSVIIIALMAFLVFECLRIASKAKDMGGRIICVGMAALLSFQTFVNIGVASGLLPNTGLPLPFMSAGVSSLLSTFIGMGLVLNVGLQRKDETVAEW